MNNSIAKGSSWSREENIATIDAYFSLFRDDLGGKKINKSATYTLLSHQFGRSPKAYGRKMSNISAILRDLGWPTMDGLKPADHYQRSLQYLLTERLRNFSLDEIIHETLQTDLSTTFGPYDLVCKSTPVISSPNPIAVDDELIDSVKRDYVEIESANRKLGLRGELLVVEHEKRVLRALGKLSLSERVEHVSLTKGDGLGYDVFSFEPSGKEKFIEVKTTNYGKYTPFFITSNEVRVSLELNENYHLYRPYNLRNALKTETSLIEYYSIRGSLENSLELIPESYRAYPKEYYSA